MERGQGWVGFGLAFLLVVKAFDGAEIGTNNGNLRSSVLPLAKKWLAARPPPSIQQIQILDVATIVTHQAAATAAAASIFFIHHLMKYYTE